ncbi:hypothetical protein DVH24_035820 [Malus domestica]|uniref:Uncharacterized protein n=1 Tax=Malus domestica TaxID=3750 RepID=A0A498JUD7_MALDO|nr:hypothetical protein DVH24_035820 [Malus domestica]
MSGHLTSPGPSTSHTINASQRDLEAEVEEGQFTGGANGGKDGGLGAFDALLEVEVQSEKER